MFEKIADFLNLAYRQRVSVIRAWEAVTSFFSGGFSAKKIVAMVVAITEMFTCVLFDGAMTPSGEKVDLTGYTEVFFDDFEGNALNTDVWEYRASGSRRGGYNAESQVAVKDGNLIMTAEYLENGTYGEGWYAGMIKLRQRYKQGYFEIRCKCNKGPGFWSAFWIQATAPYDHNISKGGVGGAEIDIFENMPSNEKNIFKRGCVTQTIHCNGVDDDVENIDSFPLGKYKGNNIYDEFNTYAVKWTEDEYIFYINGVETDRTSFGKGTSQVEEDVIVSLEIPNEDALEKMEKTVKTQYIVDYVKIMQLAPTQGETVM